MFQFEVSTQVSVDSRQQIQTDGMHAQRPENPWTVSSE
jgi:hypothetical protein